MPALEPTVDTQPDRADSSSPVRVAVVSEADATGDVARLYDELRPRFLGLVPDVFKLVSTRPEMLEVLVSGHRSMFDSGHLSRDAKEVIALTVARTASCQYCSTAHDTLLRLTVNDSVYADAIASGDLDHPAVPAAIRPLAKLARDITEHAYRITDSDFERLEASGFSRTQILEAVWVACIFNGIVRLADTLGLRELGQIPD